MRCTTQPEPVIVLGYAQFKVAHLSANPGKISRCDVKMYNTIKMFKFLPLPGDAILKLPGIIVIGDTGPVGLFILPYSFQPCIHLVAQPG